MGVTSSTFLDTYPDEIQQMKLLMLKYVQTLRTWLEQGEVPFGIGNNKHLPKTVLKMTDNGYPILPIPIPSSLWVKRDWEDLYTLYMGQHYSTSRQLDVAWDFLI